MSGRKVCGHLPLNSPIDSRSIILSFISVQSSHRVIVESISLHLPSTLSSHNNYFFHLPFLFPLLPTACNHSFLYQFQSSSSSPPTNLAPTQPRHNRRHPPNFPHRRSNAHMPTLLHRARNSQRPRIKILQARSRPPRPT